MYNNYLKNMNTLEDVPHSGVHIESHPICTHIVGTLPRIWTIYTKGYTQFRKDEHQVYYYKDLTFSLTDGWFVSNNTTVILPQRTNITTIERLALSLGLTIGSEDQEFTINIQDTSFVKVAHILTSLALKDISILPNYFSQAKQLKYGEVVFTAYLESVRGSGRILSRTKSIRWLNEQDTLQLKSKLFRLSDTQKYKAGGYSMKYTPTAFAEDILSNMFKLLKAIDFTHNDIELEQLDFIVTMEQLEQIKLRDVMLLLNCCIGYNDGFVIRPVLTDYQESRVYSVFTSISADTRKLLGFYNYDIGSALQTICLNLVKYDSMYPLHKELMEDKILFRSKVMSETNQDLLWVKTELSKIDNLDKMPKKYNKYPILEVYYHEAQKLRAEIISTSEFKLLQTAKDFAKNRWDKIWDSEKEKYEFHINIDEHKESSIFFFIWTQWERQIRHCMMSCFDIPESCHQVHDAVYSKQVLDTRQIEEKVLEDTGFIVQISTE